MTPCNINTEVVVVSLEVGVVQTYATHTPERSRPSYDNEQKLLVIPMKHATRVKPERMKEDKKFYVVPEESACTYVYFGERGLHATNACKDSSFLEIEETKHAWLIWRICWLLVQGCKYRNFIQLELKEMSLQVTTLTCHAHLKR